MKKTLGIIINNQSNNLMPLTGHRNPITLPFFARYRLIDFALSNMVNSKITKIGILLLGFIFLMPFVLPPVFIFDQIKKN